MKVIFTVRKPLRHSSGPTGPDLPNTNIHELTITKRHGSRVLGQLWILSGAFAGPIMATAKCFFLIIMYFLNRLDYTIRR